MLLVPDMRIEVSISVPEEIMTIKELSFYLKINKKTIYKFAK